MSEDIPISFQGVNRIAVFWSQPTHTTHSRFIIDLHDYSFGNLSFASVNARENESEARGAMLTVDR